MVIDKKRIISYQTMNISMMQEQGSLLKPVKAMDAVVKEFATEEEQKHLEKQLRSEKMSEEIHGVNKVTEESLALVIHSVQRVE
jgi:hypothetical protein